MFRREVVLSHQGNLGGWVGTDVLAQEAQLRELKVGQRWRLRSPLLLEERDAHHCVYPGASSSASVSLTSMFHSLPLSLIYII